MENQNINWRDAIFGEVIDKHQDWYLKESGTYWNSMHKKWYVRGLDKCKQATAFQNKMIAMKDYIKSNITKGRFVVTNENAFDLMQGNDASVKVEEEGQTYFAKIKI